MDDLSNVSANDASYRGGAYYWVDNDVKISGNTTLYNVAHLGYGEGHKAHNLIDNATGKSYGTNLMVIALNAADQRASIRPFTYLAQAKVVFAAAPAFQDGSWHRYQIQKGICSDEVESPITRIRIQSSAMNANLMNIRSIYNDKVISKTILNSTVNLEASVTGAGAVGVLLYDNRQLY